MKPNIQAERFFLDVPKNSKRWEQHQHTEWPQITSEGFFLSFFFFCHRARSSYWSLLLKEQWGVLRLWRWRRKLALRNDRLLYEQGRLSQFHFKTVLHWIIPSMKMNHAEIRQVICHKKAIENVSSVELSICENTTQQPDPHCCVHTQWTLWQT